MNTDRHRFMTASQIAADIAKQNAQQEIQAEAPKKNIPFGRIALAAAAAAAVVAIVIVKIQSDN